MPCKTDRAMRPIHEWNEWERGGDRVVLSVWTAMSSKSVSAFFIEFVPPERNPEIHKSNVQYRRT